MTVSVRNNIIIYLHWHVQQFSCSLYARNEMLLLATGAFNNSWEKGNVIILKTSPFHVCYGLSNGYCYPFQQLLQIDSKLIFSSLLLHHDIIITIK